MSVCIVNVYKADSLMPSLQVDAFRKNDLNVIEFGSSVCSPNGNSIFTSKTTIGKSQSIDYKTLRIFKKFMTWIIIDFT